jgi:hypothetical protein
MSPLKILIDVVGGGALVFLLLVVIGFDKWTSWRARSAVEAPAGPNTLEVRNVTATANQAPTEQKKLRIAVLTDPVRNPFNNNQMVWDDMGSLLEQLGEGYKHDALRTSDVLANPKKLDDYDVLFFTCAPKGQELRDALVSFVSRGGILYASDWRYDAVANAFPDMVDASVRGSGVKGTVNAEVVDAGLREIIGPTIHLNFDLPEWKTAAFGGPRVTVLIKGKYQKMRIPTDQVGTPAVAPLLVRFPVGRGGQVIFTSFHNEKQTSETEKKLLEYLVFTMMTAKVEADLQSHITEGGFAPQRSNLLSTPKNNPEVTQKFQNAKVGPLRIALGFRNEGARLKLHLRSPDGGHYTWEGTSTVVLEVPHAAAGEWSCTITALSLPYENFPFVVTVGEKK